MAVPDFAAYTAWTVATLLLSLRLGATLLLTPLLSALEAPPTVTVLLVLGLSAALVAAGDSTGMQAYGVLASDPAKLLQAGSTELALGITLAVAVHVALSAFTMAGRLLDIQIGFGLSQVFDPASRSAQPLLSSLYNRAGVLVFFLVNGHHALLRAIGVSLERFPIGRPWPLEAALWPTVKMAGALFALAVALAAPVIFCIVMTEFALAILARNLPQMNMITMGVPIKIVVGLIALSFWFTSIGAVADRVYSAIFSSWNAILASNALPHGGSSELC